MKAGTEAIGLFGIPKRRALIGLGVLIALKIVLLFMMAQHSRFVMDEFGQLGYAKYIGHGLFEDVQPPKAVGFALFYKLAHLIGWDASSILIAARMLTALLACATLGLIYACARALGQTQPRALAILLILLCFSNFIERIFRTISEAPALFFAAASLLVVLHPLSIRRIVFAGMLGGLAFLTTQKSLYFNVALGMGLVVNAAAMREYGRAVAHGAALVCGWLLSVAAYCVLFGGTDPLPILQSLIFGPVEVASRGGVEYGGLRGFVLQTLQRNFILYIFCFGGMALALTGFRKLDERRRIALVFTWVITILIFLHDQPWPYVFIMALPFMALWPLGPFDRLARDRHAVRIAMILLAVAVIFSFVRDIRYLQIDNRTQLLLVERAEVLLKPDDVYFDGIGMLPNRREPSTLWLDRFHVLKTLREGRKSEAYEIFSQAPPKMILWSYRMEVIDPVIAPLVRHAYVQIAPNIRMAGRHLQPGRPEIFRIPVRGRYRLYTKAGIPKPGKVEVDGTILASPFHLEPGVTTVVLRGGAEDLYLLPEGPYAGRLATGRDNATLFADVYK